MPLAHNDTASFANENAEGDSTAKDYGRYSIQPMRQANSKSYLQAHTAMSNKRMQQERSRVGQGGTSLSNRHQRAALGSLSQANSSKNLNMRTSNISDSRFKMPKHNSVVELQDSSSP